MIFKDLVLSMRGTRLRRQQHPKIKSEIQPPNPVPESSHEKMVEEEIPVQDQRSKIKQFFKDEDHSTVKNDVSLYNAISTRYNELLKELVMNENSLKDFNLSDEEKKILNERVDLWLEYFVSSATFNRSDDVNLFEFMDYFTETQKFV